jgi:predicted DNA-binding protein
VRDRKLEVALTEDEQRRLARAAIAADLPAATLVRQLIERHLAELEGKT